MSFTKFKTHTWLFIF